MNTEFLQMFSELFPDHPVMIVTDQVKQSDWIAASEPYCLRHVESERGYDVFIDLAYGQVILVKGDTIVNWGKYFTQADDCICLDKEYYNVAKYLWF